MTEIRIGIDLGGTKTELIAIDHLGNEQLRKRTNTPKNDYEATIRNIQVMVEDAEKTLGQKGTVGIGTPGAISKTTGLIKNSNSTWLNGQPLDRDLSEALAREVRIANDANCFALSEAVDGAGAQYGMVFGVIIGTGVGAGVCINKTIHSGPNSIAGEWGHNPLPWTNKADLPAPDCYCGKQGCIETYLSGPGLQFHNDDLSLYEDRLARALAHIINILDPDAIVLGGGLSNIESLYHNVPALWGQYVFSDHVATPLLKNTHGDSSGVRGAAWLWPL